MASTNILIIFHGPVALWPVTERDGAWAREDDSDYNALSSAKVSSVVFTGLSSVTVLVSFLCLPSHILTLSIVNLQFSAVLHHLVSLPLPLSSTLFSLIAFLPLSRAPIGVYASL